MTKRLLATGVLVWLLAFSAPAVAQPSPQRTQGVRTVIMVLAPYLSWDDIASGEMPETRELAEGAALANMNVRCLLPRAGWPSPDQGALMLSAGTWARWDATSTPPHPAPGGRGAIFPGLAKQVRVNAEGDADVRPGTLGQAIVDAGGVTAAIGNSDGARLSRPAAIVAMDRRGRVALGDISASTLASPSVAGGRASSDPARIREALDEALTRRASVPGPALIVVDPGDVGRLQATLDRPVPPARGSRQWAEALRAFDDSLAAVRAGVGEDVVLIVATQVAPAVEGEPSGFGPLIISGKGWTGTITSPSTHREGLLTNADLTATTLDILGIRPPLQVAGAGVSSKAVPDRAGERLLGLSRTDRFMRAVDDARGRIVDGFIFALIVALTASLAILRLPDPSRRMVRFGQLMLLAVATVPLAALAMNALNRHPQSTTMVIALLIATAVALWVVLSAVRSGSGVPALAALSLATAAAVIVDQWFGAPLSLDGVFSYSPLVGARYYGIGNEAAGILFGAAVTGLALAFDLAPGSDSRARRWLVPFAGLVAVITCAAPFFGANVGVAVWGTFAFALAWWGMLGRKVGPRVVLAVSVAVVAIIGVLAAIDLMLPGNATHLARSLQSAGEGGPGQLWTIVVRKASTNLRVLLSTSWSYAFAAFVALLTYVRVHPKGALRDMLVENPNFASALSASLIAAGIAYFTEDSGVVVTALLLLFPTVGVLYVMLSRLQKAQP